MLGSTTRQSSLFYLPLASQISLIKDDLLDHVDPLLEDQDLLELVRGKLRTRRKHSAHTGRQSIAPDRLLRCCVLKHLKDWSFRELERELRCNLVYRRFTRFDADPTPNYSTFSRNFAVMGPELMQRLHVRVVEMAREGGIARGQKLRTDTTVVETNIHHPTDSSLLGDGIRVLSRALGRLAQHCQEGALVVVDHSRAVKNRLLEISRAAKGRSEASRKRLKDSYGKLVALTRGVVRQTNQVLAQVNEGRLVLTGSLLQVMAQLACLEHYLPLVEKVISQTRQRVFEGNNYAQGKVLSLFEPETQVICKGKQHKPAEFGRLVRIDEVEGGIVSHCEVLEGNPADTSELLPAISKTQALFERTPNTATADRGYFSAENEKQAKLLGVKRVAVPARGRLSRTRAELQKQRWFRRALRWRVGIESRIATLKHRFGMERARYKGERGFKRHVAWSVITNNLVGIARGKLLRQMRREDQPCLPS
jgi:IS5 family transposase